MVKLNCVIINGVYCGNSFSVEVDERGKIKNLWGAIAGKEQFDGANADGLQLVLAKKGDKWLDYPEAVAVTFDDQKHQYPQDYELMNPFAPTTDYFGEGLSSRKVHVLVVGPRGTGSEATAPKRPQAETTERAGKKQKAKATKRFLRDEAVEIAAVGRGLDRETDLEVDKLLALDNLLRAGIQGRVLNTRIFNGLYIRQEYWDLYKIIMREVKTDKELCRILVLGSPGVGKSVFGVFLLLVFLMEKRDVAYHPLRHPFTYYFTWNNPGGYEISPGPQDGKMYEGLFDGDDYGGALELGVFSYAYVFASPRQKNYNHFKKEACFTVYMNPWTRDECQQFADAIHMEDQEWFQRFNLAGGKPRFLFKSSQDFDELAQEVEKAVPSNIDALKKMVNDFDFDAEAFQHSLFNCYRSKESPSSYYLTFSSLAVEAIVSTRYHVGSAEQYRELLKTPVKDLQSWRGRELEKILLQDLATCEVCMRRLDGNSAGAVSPLGPLKASGSSGTVLHLDPLYAKSKIIQASAEIENELKLNIPLSKAFPAIDAVLVVPNARLVIYAQSTVGKGYPIKYQLLKDVHQVLTRSERFPGFRHTLLFVVTNDIYDEFPVQPYKNQDGKNRTMEVDFQVEQWVGKIPERERKKTQPSDED